MVAAGALAGTICGVTLYAWINVALKMTGISIPVRETMPMILPLIAVGAVVGVITEHL